MAEKRALQNYTKRVHDKRVKKIANDWKNDGRTVKADLDGWDKPSKQEIKDWYNRHYRSKGIESMRPYEAYPVFLDYVGAQKGKKLLDIGCGTGFLLLAASTMGLETYGIDISEEALKIAKNVSPTSIISVGKGENLEFEDKTFDYITCLGSLEHFLEMDKALQEMIRVTKENALFCIMVPNSNFLFCKKGTNQIKETLSSLKEWENFFINNGFEIVKIHQDKYPASSIISKLIWTFIPLNYAYQFIFVLKKR